MSGVICFKLNVTNSYFHKKIICSTVTNISSSFRQQMQLSIWIAVTNRLFKYNEMNMSKMI